MKCRNRSGRKGRFYNCEKDRPSDRSTGGNDVARIEEKESRKRRKKRRSREGSRQESEGMLYEIGLISCCFKRDWLFSILDPFSAENSFESQIEYLRDPVVAFSVSDNSSPSTTTASVCRTFLVTNDGTADSLAEKIRSQKTVYEIGVESLIIEVLSK